MRRKVPAESEPALFDLTPYIVEPAGEYIPDSSWDKFDSVTEAKHLEDDSVTPSEDPVTESLDQEEDPVTESKSGCLSIYWPGGSARGDVKYYRYSWRNGSRLQHLHVPGGNICNAIAQQRAQKIRDAIASGMPAQEIISKFLKKA